MKIYWIGPTFSGDFSTATNWSSDTVPGSSDIAIIPGAETVHTSAATTVLAINLDASGGLLEIGSQLTAIEGTTAFGTMRGTILILDAASLSLGGVVNTGGSGVIEVGGGPDQTILKFLSGAKLEGGGTIQLDGGANELGGVFTNVDNTIEGSGTINAAINNQELGVINANGTAPLVLAGNVTNAGFLQSTNTGGLTIESTVTKAASGPALIDNATLSGATIRGGTLEGNTTVSDFSTLDGSSATLRNAGQTAVADGMTLRLLGTINNTNQIVLGLGSVIQVSAAGSLTKVTLEGAGQIVLNNDVFTSITGQDLNAPVVTLVNVNNDIAGAGTIGGNNMALNNEAGGKFRATGTRPLVIDTGSNTVTNAGLLKGDGGELFIGSALVNTGTLSGVSNGSVVVGGTVTGSGRATIDGTGQIEFGAASTNSTKFDTGSTGELILDDPGQYSGTVAGFGVGAQIDLPNFGANGAHATSYSGGVLKLKNTAGQTVQIKISGTHTLASFQVSDDGNFNGTDDGTLITDPPMQAKPQTSLVNLLGNYIASSFASIGYGDSRIPTLLTEPLLQHPISSPHA